MGKRSASRKINAAILASRVAKPQILRSIIKILVIYVLCSPLCAFGQDSVRVFYLGGQSNMDGFGYNEDLPDDLMEFNDVYIFHGNSANDGEIGGLGLWEELKPGHGKGHQSTADGNQLSDRFGMELSFAANLQKQYPGEKIALIKYSKGGTSIDTLGNPLRGTWDPYFRSKTNQYDHFLATLRNACANTDIDHDGVEEILIPSGIIWMQGESDAATAEMASRYLDHLWKLMTLFRAALRDDDLPVVIGKISDSWHERYNGKVWKYGELIQHAQEEFVRTDKKAAIVRQTRYYKYSDPWHYTSDDYIDLGQRFASELVGLCD
ncbi:MAG: sialate O-acetylesterase [Cyclobacteriaceae bacterium]